MVHAFESSRETPTPKISRTINWQFFILQLLLSSRREQQPHCSGQCFIKSNIFPAEQFSMEQFIRRSQESSLSAKAPSEGHSRSKKKEKLGKCRRFPLQVGAHNRNQCVQDSGKKHYNFITHAYT